jgi:hypothetical protein
MSDAIDPAARESLAPPLLAGFLSGLLYGTAILGIAFLIPVQITYGRRGKRAGLVAAAIALGVASLVQLGEVLASGGFGSELFMIGTMTPATFLLVAVLPPAVLLGALVLMNASFWRGSGAWARDFSGTALASFAAAPAVVALSRSTAFMDACEAQIGKTLNGIAGQAQAGAAQASLFSAVDIKEMARLSFTILESSFVPLLLVFLAGSRWIGNRASGEGSEGREESRTLSDYRLPSWLVWPFMAAWAGVLYVSYFKVGLPWSGLAWNLAIAFSLAYLVQGTGIASFLMRSWNMPRSLRILVAVSAVIIFLQPPVGTALIAALPLLGVSEVWINYRNPKGVGA